MMKYHIKLFIIFLLSIKFLYAQPGGVNGTKLWLRADLGVTTSGSKVTTWDDQSGNSNSASQPNATYQPTYVNKDANFNPSFYYTDHFLDVSYDTDLNGEDLTVFVVVDSDGGSGWRSPWTTREDSPSRGHILYYNDKYRYWTGNGTNGGWDQLIKGDTTNNYEIITTTSKAKNNNRIRKDIYLQGLRLGNQTVNFSPNTQYPFRIGKGATEDVNGNYPWYGNISEVIVYSEKLESKDRRKIESYLAVKYGITLNQSNNGKNYYDSGAYRFWQVSKNDGYGNDIAGVGNDNVSNLDQKVSKSINSDAIITMSTNNNFTEENLDNSRPSLSNSNRRFLMWSNDNGGHGWTSTGAPSGGKILQRKWKVQKTKSNQHSINIAVDVDDLDFNIDNFNGTLYFVKGTDLSTATPISMIDDGNGKWYIENIDFDDAELFSFVVNPIQLSMQKTSMVTADGVNATHPKRIPGATIRYCFTVDNTGEGNADNVKIDDSLTGNGKENLIYVKAGSMIQNISTACDCASSSMDDSKGSISGTDVTIDIGTLTGTSATATSRGCAYIEMTIK